ncbi:hypothetical protein JVT61DRAFT_1688 [Boletus reticuloceps]|uniref:Uncharacterized protein n=1 Tax=Boletus reticuloceps TaxID=495285 RepID=A0A8I2YRF0_9AGAM|nr:hypothetical protein JVT61DRAFT_1688 [Boletus reticuloceps]
MIAAVGMESMATTNKMMIHSMRKKFWSTSLPENQLFAATYWIIGTGLVTLCVTACLFGNFSSVLGRLPSTLQCNTTVPSMLMMKTLITTCNKLIEHVSQAVHAVSHCITVRTHPVVPVIIGDALPKRNGDAIHDKEYFRYLLLLFKLWRSYEDLCSDGSSWKDAFEQSVFSSYCRSLISNMEVDAECRDARAIINANLAEQDSGFSRPLDNEDSKLAVDSGPLSELLTQDDNILNASKMKRKCSTSHNRFATMWRPTWGALMGCALK